MSTLYKDRLVKITDEEVVLHRYYFPFGGDKRVPLTALAGVQVRQPSFFVGSWRLWGTGDFRTWFPLDYKRPGRDRIFLASLRDSERRIGFTVENSEKVTNILSAKGLLRGTPAA